MAKKENFTIAVAGNPNCGKTTLFNELTGGKQRVGNWLGVTVEKKAGSYVNNGNKTNIVDLPGTYSLTAYSMEEIVARDYLVNEKPAVVINIIDASNLERNLFLVTELLEIGRPLVIALNMVDVARDRDLKIDVARLADKLGVPAVGTGATFQQLLGNMNVVSNVAGVVEVTGSDAGNIEFWPTNYSGTARYRWLSTKYSNPEPARRTPNTVFLICLTFGRPACLA